MIARPHYLLTTLGVAAACIAGIAEHTIAADGTSISDASAVFVTKHCHECHSGSNPEAGFDVDSLSPSLAAAESMRFWTLIHDRVAQGEMPPKGVDQPSPNERATFLSQTSGTLARADAVTREVVLRRLNRVEYENTVNDLFGIDARLQNILPEDASADGFDNVGDALAVSTELMQAYLDAAEVALDAVFGPEKEPPRVNVTFPLSKDVQGKIGTQFRQTEDGVALFDCGYCPSSFRTFISKVPGTYRVKIHAKAFQSEKPVTMSVHGGDVIVGRRPKHLVGHYDLLPDKMTVIEFEDRIGFRDTFHPKPYGIGNTRRKNQEWKGPGIVIGDISVEGPLEPWPPVSRATLVGDLDTANAGAEDAKRILTKLLPRASRRRVTQDEIARHQAHVTTALDAGRPFEESLRVGLKSVLCSPSFLFLEEPADTSNGHITDEALASRLAYFLWSNQPDEQLLKLAAAGQLHEPAVLRTQVERLLRDSKASEFTENFTGQWLDLRDISFTEPDRTLYPEFDELLKVSMVEETHRFFEEILGNDRSLLEFVDSDWLILNERLAKHYEIDGVTGQEFRVVKRPPNSVRGGVLTQASVLKVTANGSNTSPIVRGVWLLENIMGEHIPPPPAGVPAIEPDIRGATTIREQLDKHRNIQSCAVCHRKIDPPGFALESFDVMGAHRDWYRTVGEGERVDKYIEKNANVRVRYRKGRDVDCSGTATTGQEFSDIRDFKKILLENKDQIARGLTEKLLTYGLGRSLGFSDRQAVQQIVAQLKSQNYGLRSLIHEITQSENFRKP
jgi:mono/diheme cytochrome c family protein